MSVIKVDGEKNEHKVFLYTLSTCGWCKRTKEFLKENGVAYEYLDVDKCTSDERKKAIEYMKSKKASMGFPLAIIDDEILISGFKPDKYKEVLKL
jgi:glutaredoxin